MEGLPTFPPFHLPTFPPSHLPTFSPSHLPTFPPSLLPSFPPFLYMINVTSKTCTRLKSHHKWAYWRLRATQLVALQIEVLHRQGSKCPRKPIPGPYTDCPALSQEQSKTSTWHLLGQTPPPRGGPETTSVLDMFVFCTNLCFIYKSLL
jgi:hypothetical protein